MKKIITIFCLFLLSMGAQAAGTWPQKPIKIIIPYSPGGTTDIIIRTLQPKLSQLLDQSITIEYAPGASASIGIGKAAEADDNHTFLATADEFVTNTLVDPGGKHNFNNFLPVALMASSPIVITTHMQSPITDVRQLLATEKLSYGNAGTRSVSALVVAKTKPQWTSINYKGGAPMFLDLIPGHIDLGATSILQAASHIESGKITPLLVYSKTRSPFLPQVPTSFEMGIPIEGIVWMGIMAPKSLDKKIIAKVSKAFVDALNDKNLVKPLIDRGLAIEAKNSNEFSKFLTTQIESMKIFLKDLP